MLRALTRFEPELLWVVGATILVSRLLLAYYSPWAFGYIYDPYYDAVEKVYQTGQIPGSTDCWECYHPPLYQLVSLPFYAVGRLPSVVHFVELEGWPADTSMYLMEIVPLASSVICLWYTFRLLKLFRLRGACLVLAMGVAGALPVVFFSSYSLEPDMLLAAMVTMFAYYATRWVLRPDSATRTDALRLGALAGLAAATKYSGLAAVVVGVLLLGTQLLFTPHRRHAANQLALFLLAAAILGSYKYIHNVVQYGTPFFAARGVEEGFRLNTTVSYRNLYQFSTFRLGELLSLTRPDAPPGMLTLLPIYRSFWTTLHGQTWGDMGFFTNPTRHGMGRALYDNRHIAPWLAASVLVLGLMPAVLVAIGFVRTLLRRAYRPLALLSVVGFSSFLHWVVAQRYWSIKTKYVLFLLPAYAVYQAVGMRWAVRMLPEWLSEVIVATLVALVVLADFYLFSFAIG